MFRYAATLLDSNKRKNEYIHLKKIYKRFVMEASWPKATQYPFSITTRTNE